MHISMSRKRSGIGEGWIQADSDFSAAMGPGEEGGAVNRQYASYQSSTVTHVF